MNIIESPIGLDVVRLAKEAGLEQVVAIDPKNGTRLVKSLPPELLERFAALIKAEREWVDLTDDEIDSINALPWGTSGGYAKAVIAAFKAKQEKNK